MDGVLADTRELSTIQLAMGKRYLLPSIGWACLHACNTTSAAQHKRPPAVRPTLPASLDPLPLTGGLMLPASLALLPRPPRQVVRYRRPC